MKPFLTALAFLACLAVAGESHSTIPSKQSALTGDPCNKPMNQAEMNACRAEEYRKADAHLNAVYKRLLSSMESDLAEAHGPADIGWDQQEIRDLKDAEHAWINYRDLHCAAARFETEPGTISPARWSVCMTIVTDHRIEEMKNAYELGDRKLE